MSNQPTADDAGVDGVRLSTEYRYQQLALQIRFADELLAIRTNDEEFAGDDEFHVFLNTLIDLGIKPTELEKGLFTSSANISRWRSNQSRPPKHSRVAMVRSLFDLLEKHAAVLREEMALFDAKVA